MYVQKKKNVYSEKEKYLFRKRKNVNSEEKEKKVYSEKKSNLYNVSW